MASIAQASPGPGGASLHPRSCVTCRQRKVKCDRQQPCSNCTRSQCDCVYPQGRGRAPKRPRAAVDAQLVEKLTRLEGLIQRMARKENAKRDTAAAGAAEPDPEPGAEAAVKKTTTNTTTTPTAAPSSSSTIATNVNEGQMSRLVINDENSYYVSNPLWASLTAEIDEMRGMIGAESDDDEDADFDDDIPAENALTNAALFGFRSTAYSLRSMHPPQSQAMALLAAFTTNVQPLLPIFHLPTLTATYTTALANLDTLDRATEALLFTIYYAAHISTPSSTPPSPRHRFAAEQALARADLLNTHSLTVLQALVLYLAALRNQDASRTAWSLTTLAYHLARAMGLHRDGAAFGLAPRDAELRRRLWWVISLLEGRAAATHGFAPVVVLLGAAGGDVDVRLPEALDDEDDGMVFLAVRCEVLAEAVRMRLLYGGGRDGMPSTEEKMAAYRQLETRLEARYFGNPRSETKPILVLSSLLARLMLVNLWLMIHYPLRRGGDSATISTASSPLQQQPSLRERIYQKSIELLDITAQLLDTPVLAPWIWFMRTHIQWQSVALVLSELCWGQWSPGDAEWERGWAGVMRLYGLWEREDRDGGGGLGGEKRGLMWKGVRRLMAQATGIRERWRAAAAAADGQQNKGKTVLDTPQEPMAGMDLTPTLQAGPFDQYGFQNTDSQWYDMLAMPMDAEMGGMLGSFGADAAGFPYPGLDGVGQGDNSQQGSGLQWNGW